MKILLRPGDVLAAFLPRAAVATGRSTSSGANKLAGIFPALPYFSGKGVYANRYKQKRRPAEHGGEVITPAANRATANSSPGRTRN
jgi:hypothetical protein